MSKERSIQDIYSLSPMQSGMLFHSIMNREPGTYFEQTIFSLKGPVDPVLLEKSFVRVVERHDILRTVFRFEKVKEPLQFVLKTRQFKLHFEDLVGKEDSEKERYIEEFIRNDTTRGFDLGRDLLIRAALFRTGNDDYRLIWSYHHIIMDGWCRSLIFIDLIRVYSSLRNNRPLELPPPAPYKKYIHWIEQQDKEEGYKYWRDYLEGYDKQATLPDAWKLKTGGPYELKKHLLDIEESIVNRLSKIALENKTTVNILFQTVWGLLLQAYNQTGDVVFGAVVSGRPPEIEGIEEMVGLFINTIPVRITTANHKNFQQLLETVQQQALMSKPYEYLPLGEVQANSLLKGNLIHHIMAYESYPVDEAVKQADDEKGLGFVIADVKSIEKINYDFYLSIFPGQVYRVEFNYNSRLYRSEAIEATVRHFHHLLRQAAENPVLALSKIEIVTEPEKQQLLYDFCHQEAAYPEEKTLDVLFAEQAAKTPDSSALVLGSQQLSYGELNRRAHALAGVLSAKGVKQGTIVGILVNRSVEMIIGLLAILKAGAAYMPIDPDYPQDRIDYMLKDSNTKILLKDNDFTPEAFNNRPEGTSSHLHLSPAPATSLAYIIYTSGTTGRPKGVMIEHGNVVRLLFNDRFQFDFNSRDTWTMFHSYCFDFSVWEMYGALLYGGRLIVIPKMTARDPGDFLRILKKESVTVLNQTPSAFYNLIHQELAHQNSQLRLRYVIFGGEALKPGKLAEWRKKYPDTTLVNMFGITETTVHVTYKEITWEEIQQKVSNIGSSIPTLSTYIMDRNRRLLPPGIPGELCVGGAGVARGYLNKPQLTAEKFIQNPYKKGERLYLSGDLAQLTPAGDMEYLGRIDRQVQIRGFRVELEEIENRLLMHDEIDDAVVTARTDENGGISLCGYIVAASQFSVSRLRKYLSETLPDHMIPAYFEHLDRLPLTPNGKVDRKALPAPGVKPGDGFVEPRSILEIQLAGIWKDFLQLEQVSVKDSFFNVGGDSIKAIRLISLINSQLNSRLKIENLYQNDTIEELARILYQDEETGLDIRMKEVALEITGLKRQVLEKKAPDDEIEDIYPMSDIEKGMVFLSSLHPQEAIYHDQNVYQVKYRQFDSHVFKKAAEIMAVKHPILRTTFNLYDFEEPVQIVGEKISLDVHHLEISHLTTAEKEEHIKKFLEEDRTQPFDVNLPLWRIRTFGLGGDDFLVALICHHSILDGWSVASFSTELNNTYLKLKEDPDFVPDPLKSSYKDFVIEQIAQKRHEHTIGFWIKELQNYKRLDIKALQEPGFTNTGSQTYSRTLESSLLEQLKRTAGTNHSNIKNICFAAYMYLMSMVSYDNDLVVGLVTNNRPLREDGDKILGCFLNSVPVRFFIPSRVKCRDYIKAVENKILELKKYDRLPLFEIARIIGETPEERNPIFDTLFNFTDFHIYGQAEISPGSGEENQRLAVDSYAKNNTLFDINIDHTFGLLSVILKYDGSLITKETAEKLSGYYNRILEKLAGDPEAMMSKDGIMDESERRRLLYDFNQTTTPYPADQTIHELFEDQVERNPDNIALLGPIQNAEGTGGLAYLSYMSHMSYISYKELNEKSNQLARVLNQQRVETGEIVAIMCPRSLEMAISIMAVLKAGAAYLPIDPDYPGERIEFMLKDSNAGILLKGNAVEPGKSEIRISKSETKPNDQNPNDQNNVSTPIVLNFEHLNFEFVSNFEFRASDLNSSNLAYIIYTSGTTGRPKGVAVQHKSAVNTLVCRKNAYALGPGHAALQLFSYAFDGFVTSFFTPLISGAAVVLPGDDGITDILKIKAIILKNKITHFIVIPPLYRALIEYLTPAELVSLQVVTLAGDRVTPDLPEITKKKNHKIEIANEYGVTEAAVMSTMYRHMSEGDQTIIGTPTWNTAVLILDKSNGLLPEGVPGELCMSGVGVASGYLNRPELTAERFIDNPFVPAARMYKTADLARWLPQGNIEFLGRIDHQVKIRGFRVELGEIETRLVKYAGIKEALVLVIGRGSQSPGQDKSQQGLLCAYIVPARESTFPDITELREYLSKELPDYMIPAHFVRVEKIPVTANGKIDRKKLPLPETLAPGSGEAAPQTNLEKIIANIWTEVLQVDRVGINDNLFELGGNSLDVMKIVYKLTREFNKEVPAVTMFKYPTIGLLAEYFSKEDVGEGVLEEQTILPAARVKSKNRLEMMKRKRREI